MLLLAYLRYVAAARENEAWLALETARREALAVAAAVDRAPPAAVDSLRVATLEMELNEARISGERYRQQHLTSKAMLEARVEALKRKVATLRTESEQPGLARPPLGATPPRLAPLALRSDRVRLSQLFSPGNKVAPGAAGAAASRTPARHRLLFDSTDVEDGGFAKAVRVGVGATVRAARTPVPTGKRKLLHRELFSEDLPRQAVASSSQQLGSPRKRLGSPLPERGVKRFKIG